MSAPIIHFDYEREAAGAKETQKTKLLLTAAGINFQRVDQPAVLPRPDLEKLGITYRRIPLLAVGKDVYADSAAIVSVVLESLGGKKSIATTPADKAYEAWGNATFQAILPLVPQQALTPAFVKDRKTIFPILERHDLETLSPSATAELQSRMAYIEDTLLANGQYVGGDKLSLADIHVIWPIRWVLFDLGVQQRPGFGKDAFPKVWRLIESLPPAKPETLSSEDALEAIQDAQPTVKSTGVAKDDPLGIKDGAMVTVESMDSTPGAHPQAGRLLASSRHEVILALDTGVQLHFPRNGYIVRETGSSKL